MIWENLLTTVLVTNYCLYRTTQEFRNKGIIIHQTIQMAVFKINIQIPIAFIYTNKLKILVGIYYQAMLIVIKLDQNK